MSEDEKNTESAPASKRRFAVLEDKSGAKTMIARITLTGRDEGPFTFELSTEDEGTAQSLKSVFDFEAHKDKLPTSPTMDAAIIHITDLAEAGGYKLEELPDGDFVFNLTLDTVSGRMLSSQSALHPHATAPDTLAQDLHNAIAGMFRDMPQKVSNAINEAIAAGDHQKAATELETAAKSGQLVAPPTNELLAAIASIDLTQLSGIPLQGTREILMATAQKLDRLDIAAEQAEILLSNPSYTQGQRADLELIIAHDAMHRGQVETAMTIWRRLVRSPELMEPETRAWAWRNIATMLGPENPETASASKNSASAFLQAGMKTEAAKSLMAATNALLHTNPQEALQLLADMEPLADQQGIENLEMRAAFRHAKGNRLSALGKHEEALKDAQQAVTLRRGVLGAERELISSLWLVEQELKRLGRKQEAEAVAIEAKSLTSKVDDAHFKLANRAAELMENFDAAQAAAILLEARREKNWEVAAGMQTAIAIFDNSLSDRKKLSMLEAAIVELKDNGLKKEAMAPMLGALADQLIAMGELERAELKLRDILSLNPLEKNARAKLIDLLWKLEKWGDAAIFIRKQIVLWGPLPGLLSALGKSLLKSGNLNEAVTVLTNASDAAGDDAELKAHALKFREEAIRMGGTFQTPHPPKPVTTVVTLDDFDSALTEFCIFVSADKRMSFWQKVDNDHSWIPSPERHGQHLLHTYLKGRFGDRIAVFEEIAAGAGRLDVFVQLGGGLGIVVELKICGYGYASTYAASGEDQVLHYMESRKTSLGYLLVFDARLNDFGKQLLLARPPDQFTVKEAFCDVRPRISRKSSAAKT